MTFFKYIIFVKKCVRQTIVNTEKERITKAA
jgi:hypothetical protein